MKKIIIAGSNVAVIEVDEVLNALPAGNYNINVNPMSGEIYLTKMEDLKLPETEFIDTSIIDVWLKSFNHHNSNLGILLSGLKGAGKTVLAKKLCKISNLPVLHLNQNVPMVGLSMFLSDPMFNNCIIFIDEFEKMINQNKDEEIAPFLKLMDGSYNTKLMFLLTSNRETLNDHLMNRLSRIKYRKHFTDLEEYTIERIINKYLVNQDFKEDLLNTCNKISFLSIDILINIIEEMNLFNSPSSEVIKNLNLVSESVYCDVSEIIDGEAFDCEHVKFDPSHVGNLEISRSWLNKVKKPLYEKRNEEGNESLTEEELTLLGEDNWTYFADNAKVSKTKRSYFVEDMEGRLFKLTPYIKSNLIY